MADKRVIIIGADMRKATLHERLGISSKHGLSTFLIGRDEADRIIVPTTIKNLDFIPSGPIPPNPVELLETKEFNHLLEILRSRYDVIVINNCPSLLVTDGTIVRRHTNIDLFVTRQGYTGKKLIDYINQLTENNKLGKTGIVLNDINTDKYGSYSRYGGYYRKSYGYYGDGYYSEGENGK